MLYTTLTIMLRPLNKTLTYIKGILLSILLLLAVLFTGCSKNRDVIVPKTKLVYMHIPKRLLNKDIKIPKPPTKEEYIKANPLVREKLLSIYTVELLGTVGLFKSKLNAIIEADANITNIVNKEQVK